MEILSRAGGRVYFGVQAAAGTAWWIGVAASEAVRTATLGPLPPLLVGALDVPLFVLASALAAAGLRRAAAVTTAWTLLVTLGMVLLATITGTAGWGAVAMLGAAAGSTGAWTLLRWDRIPAERVLVGPLGFRVAPPATPRTHLSSTLVQLVAFWALFLVLAPALLLVLERRWGVDLDLGPIADDVLTGLGLVLLLGGSTLGLASAITMARHGRGTPLPGRTANDLVTAGPYGTVRNPMAVAGLAQMVGVGLLAGSWAVPAVALTGAALWHVLIRPAEEADLAQRFGKPYRTYRDRVGLWVPRARPADPASPSGDVDPGRP